MLEIRPMTAEDTKEVAELEKECFSEPWTRQGFEESLAKDNYIFCVAQDEQKVVGYCGMYMVLEEGNITQVAVAKDSRGKGIGKLLLEAMLVEGGRQGMTECTLEVRISNRPAIKLYESCGFVIESTRRGFYDFPKEDAYIMWKR